jgi:hypothetical protein
MSEYVGLLTDLVKCGSCGAKIPRCIGRCHCGALRSHRDCYPEQYSHPIVGKRVSLPGILVHGLPARGVVERVVPTRFGPLAILDSNPHAAYLLSECREIGLDS